MPPVAEPIVLSSSSSISGPSEPIPPTPLVSLRTVVFVREPMPDRLVPSVSGAKVTDADGSNCVTLSAPLTGTCWLPYSSGSICAILLGSYESNSALYRLCLGSSASGTKTSSEGGKIWLAALWTCVPTRRLRREGFVGVGG